MTKHELKLLWKKLDSRVCACVFSLVGVSTFLFGFSFVLKQKTALDVFQQTLFCTNLVLTLKKVKLYGAFCEVKSKKLIVLGQSISNNGQENQIMEWAFT